METALLAPRLVPAPTLLSGRAPRGRGVLLIAAALAGAFLAVTLVSLELSRDAPAQGVTLTADPARHSAAPSSPPAGGDVAEAAPIRSPTHPTR